MLRGPFPTASTVRSPTSGSEATGPPGSASSIQVVP